MGTQKIVLASGSPRRRELMHQMGLDDFEILPAKGEENAPEALTPAQLVEQLALQKAREVAALRPDCAVIGADTVVALGDEVLGKPESEARAKEMLRALSGRHHQVYTGVSLIMAKGGQVHTRTFFEATDVTFYPISKEDLRSYTETGDSLDKAGAYGIQGPFAIHVKCIRGDYNNVVGLPVSRLYQELLREYVSPLSLP